VKQTTIEIPEFLDIVELLGTKDAYLNMIKRDTDCKMSVRGDQIDVFGSDIEVDRICAVFDRMMQITAAKQGLTTTDVALFLKQSREGSIYIPEEDNVILKYGKKEIRTKTAGQTRYLQSLRDNDITICTAPPGASKTFTAVAYGLNMLINREIDNIIITRPLVEAGGEKIGAEPGDMNTKLTNWMLPCLDVFERVLGKEQLQSHIDKDKIRMIALGRMRGLSFYRSFVIADEMQNSSIVLAKLVATRIGEQSKICIIGDPAQKDSDRRSGLDYLEHACKNIDGVGVVKMGNEDVVRHPIITKLLDAFDKEDKRINNSDQF
jgi:phosphate starvation-inducible PhoH-like protein